MALKACVDIETLFANGRTVLKHSFCSSPFKLADITDSYNRRELELMLMCASPGVLDGDEYDFHFHLGEGSSLKLETQSYQRLFRMEQGASQRMDVRLEDGASLSWLPHPLVPHAGAIFTSKNTIHLSASSSLIWGDVMSCGRRYNGEVFLFSSCHSTTTIFLNGKLAVKENILLKPREWDPLGMGQLEGFTHQATLLYLAQGLQMPALLEQLYREFSSNRDISFGVSLLPVNGLIVRILGCKAEQLYTILQQISSRIHSFIAAAKQPAYV